MIIIIKKVLSKISNLKTVNSITKSLMMAWVKVA